MQAPILGRAPFEILKETITIILDNRHSIDTKESYNVIRSNIIIESGVRSFNKKRV